MKQTVSIVKGTAILTAAGFFVKILGAVYRMVLSRMIGAEGIGLYQMAYPVYLIFLSLSTAGIPIAISKIVAEKSAAGDQAGVKKVVGASFILMTCLGVVSSLTMAGTAQWFATNIVADPRAIFAIWALSPAILLMSLMAVFRGFFQGQLNMQPSAYSQIFEQLVRVSVSVILAFSLLKMGIEHAAAGAAFGATAGGVAGLLYLLIVYFRRSGRRMELGPVSAKSKVGLEMGRLIKFALPISFTAILPPLLQTIDSVLVPHMLQKIGYTIKQSTTMLGILGNSWAVIYLPLIVTGAIAANLVPLISVLGGCRDQQGLQEKVSEGLRMATIYLIPAGIGLFVFGGTIYRMIYGETGITILSWFAPAVFFLGLEQVTAGILQGLGKPKWPMVSFVMGAIVKVAVTVLTTGWPGLNLAGAALGTVSGAMVTASFNLLKIRRFIGFKLRSLGRAVLAGAGMMFICGHLQKTLALPYPGEFVITGILGIAGYLIALRLMGGIGPQDLEIIKEVLRRKGTLE